jgi:hypothetical protein
VPSTPVEMVLDYEFYDGEFAGESCNVAILEAPLLCQLTSMFLELQRFYRCVLLLVPEQFSAFKIVSSFVDS